MVRPSLALMMASGTMTQTTAASTASPPAGSHSCGDPYGPPQGARRLPIPALRAMTTQKAPPSQLLCSHSRPQTCPLTRPHPMTPAAEAHRAAAGAAASARAATTPRLRARYTHVTSQTQCQAMGAGQRQLPLNRQQLAASQARAASRHSLHLTCSPLGGKHQAMMMTRGGSSRRVSRAARRSSTCRRHPLPLPHETLLPAPPTCTPRPQPLQALPLGSHLLAALPSLAQSAAR
mmetsp:Transcript_19256/g.49003  ORF Transcript_19256/g.49003 Transcript_19256/m.49003 type:complete len:234 (-) Transcript_19256:1758-2459(-)